MLDIVQTLQKTLQVLSEIILDFFLERSTYNVLLPQRWGNNSIFEYLRPNTSIRIWVTFWNPILFIFVFGQFPRTEYYLYSYLVIFQTEYYLYSYSGDFLKSEYRWEFFSENYIYFVDVNLSPHFHFSDDWINQSSKKMSGWVFFFEYSALPKLLCAPKLKFILIYQSHIGWVIWIGSCLHL